MEQRDVEIQLTRLATVMEQGFETTQREVRELKDYQREMNGKVGRAHERLAAVDQKLDGHDRELGQVRKRMHDLSNHVTGKNADLENQAPTWKTLGQALFVIGTTAGFVFWFLTGVLHWGPVK